MKPVIYNGKPYYVISMSGLQAFKRCRKSFDLAYLRGYELLDVPDPVSQGSSIHKYLACEAVGETHVADDQEMWDVVQAYVKYKPLPKDIIASEQPFYRILIEPIGQMPGVIVRCTFDLAYRQGQHIILRDYKSFEKAPSLHVDLDFQGRFYTAFGMMYFDSPHLFFEYEYIRRMLPRVPRGKSGGNFTEEECYINVPLVISVAEAAVVWKETQDVADDLVRAIDEQRMYRTDLKAGPHACSTCFMRHGCAAEIAQGKLTAQTAEMFYKVREPITLPEGITIE